MFGERLRLLREENSLTQLELSKQTGIGNVTLSQYEKGTRNPDKDTIIKIAEYFDVTTDYLLGKSNVRKPKGITRFHLKDSMEVQDLPPEAIEEFENMLDYLHEKYKDRKTKK